MKRLFKKIVALGLAATMVMGMAVTSFAADENNTVGTSATVDAPTFKDADGNAIEEAIDDIWLSGNKKATLGLGEDKTTDLTLTTVKVTATAPAGGKVLVGVTKADATKAPYDGSKVTKDGSEGIVKASLKGDTITLKSGGKAAGEALVWVMITNKDKSLAASSSFAVNVRAAANKITLGYSDEVAKKIAVPVGKTVEIDITGLSKEKGADGKEIATTDATFYAEVAEKNAENVSAEIVDGKLVVKALALAKKDDAYVAKAVSAKVTVYCGESEKKAAVTIMVTNPATDIKPEFAEKSNEALLYEKDTATVIINAVTAGKDMPTTDKVKVYVAAPAKAGVAADEENGIEAVEAIEGLKLSEDGKKVEFTKSKAVAAKLNKDGTVTLTRKEVFEEAEIWLSYTDAATKEIKLEKLAFIEKVIPTEGDVALGNDAAANYAE